MFCMKTKSYNIHLKIRLQAEKKVTLIKLLR